MSIKSVDCLDWLSSLHNVSVVAIKRTKNEAAHCLVGMAKNLGSYSWMESVPHVCSSIVL